MSASQRFSPSASEKSGSNQEVRRRHDRRRLDEAPGCKLTLSLRVQVNLRTTSEDIRSTLAHNDSLVSRSLIKRGVTDLFLLESITWKKSVNFKLNTFC